MNDVIINESVHSLNITTERDAKTSYSRNRAVPTCVTLSPWISKLSWFCGNYVVGQTSLNFGF